MHNVECHMLTPYFLGIQGVWSVTISNQQVPGYRVA